MSDQEELERYRYLQLKQKMAAAQPQPRPEVTWGEAIKHVPEVAGPALEDAARRVGPSTLPIIGGLVGGAPGAALGQTAKHAVDTVIHPEEVPKTRLGIAGSVIGAGIAQEPKMLNAIPGVPQATKYVGGKLSDAGEGLANVAQMLTGGKAKDYMQAAKQGVKTYLAPSMEKAQEIFGKAMESAGVSSKPSLKQIIDPQLTTARDVALEIGDKLEKGMDITAGEALSARQAVDRIYNHTSLMDRATRGHLAELRTAFDDVMAGKSGALKEASTIYRKAIVKDTLLNPFKITKQGQMSAVAPMVAALASGGGAASGHKSAAGIGGAGYLAASSPLVAGLLATTGGSTAQGLMKLGENPAIRQALMQTLQKIMASKKTRQNANEEAE